VRSHYSPIPKAKIKKGKKTKKKLKKRKKLTISNVGKGAEQWEQSCSAGGKAKGIPTIENNLEVSYQIKHA